MPSTSVSTLAQAALDVLLTADPLEKARLSRRAAAAWQSGEIDTLGLVEPPDIPARPPRPQLLPPRDMPRRRRAGSVAGRIALLHALAHIELNAIDLSWDIIVRFCGRHVPTIPRGFVDDWVGVADDEARHYRLLADRLADFGAAYGDHPAHDGLWQAATDTAHSLGARLAVVPLVLEARGLDVTPAMVEALHAADDPASATILQTIHDDEIGHVAVGRRWFEWWCRQDDLLPVTTYQHLVRTHFKGVLKRPFNTKSRDLAGFHAAFYEPLADQPLGTSEAASPQVS